MLYDKSKTQLSIPGGTKILPINLNRLWIVFLLFNFAMVSLDLLIAHFPNYFLLIAGDSAVPGRVLQQWQKFIPIGYSPFTAVVLFIVLVSDMKFLLTKGLLYLTIPAGIIIGILGTYYHLLPRLEISIGSLYENIIFGSPLTGPPIFILLSLYILILIRKAGNEAVKADKWLSICNGIFFLILALDTIFEHSHNYFSSLFQWIPLLIGLFAGFYLLLRGIFSLNKNRADTIIIYSIIFVSLATGAGGFLFHIIRNLSHTQIGVSSFFIRLFTGSPLFAPLLFANSGIFVLLSELRKTEVDE